MLTAEILNIPALRAEAGQRVAQAGEIYYREGRVRLRELTGEQAIFDVSGSQAYPYSITIASDQFGLIGYCECINADKGELCKHVFAAALALFDRLEAQPLNPWRTVFANHQVPTRRRQNPMLLVFSLQERGFTWTLVPYTITERAIPQAEIADPATFVTQALTKLRCAQTCQNSPNPTPAPAISRRFTSSFSFGKYACWVFTKFFLWSHLTASHHIE
ncbi:SWIM zinc finger family protein [Herpetosiphon llansteffanensis]|uniref:SWIM zinc finger family protein n=1 Tax=Herpetosiphon llansteffanensis TaxID=2094568 RepID=UPI001F0BEF80|nr:hypothetical protein [Herpetosiphon llansteffanensis]